jgi:hypothetical protein
MSWWMWLLGYVVLAVAVWRVVYIAMVDGWVGGIELSQDYDRPFVGYFAGVIGWFWPCALVVGPIFAVFYGIYRLVIARKTPAMRRRERVGALEERERVAARKLAEAERIIAEWDAKHGK